MTHIFKQPTENKEQYYCSFGNEDYIDNDGFARCEKINDNVIAKIISNKKPKHFNDKIKHDRYYIKMSPNMEVYNPISLHTTSNNNQQKFTHINKIRKDTWTFKEVDKSIFDKYLLFVKTENMQTFKDVQRQLK